MKQIIFIITAMLCQLQMLPGQSQLDRYVQTAIENNLTVQQRKALERKQEYAYQHAGKLGGPRVDFITTYTLATGGRTIGLPLGDLLNPVYNTLNDLTGMQNFENLENQEFNFLPNNFYDARFRISQPIIQPEIKYNKLIRQEEVSLAGLQTSETIRDLIRDVKTAYLQWLGAAEAVRIIDQGLMLLNENKRITEGLVKNGQAIPSAVTRIQSDVEHLLALRQKAIADQTNAASHFNFLLNLPSESEIIRDSLIGVPEIPTRADLSGREELLQIETSKKIQSLALALEEKQHAPTLGLSVDLGSQAFNAEWGGYALGGVQLTIPIWDNHQSRLKQQEWKAQLEATSHQYDWTKNAFDVQLKAETENLRADIEIYRSFTNLLTANERYYEETVRRYKEGMSNYIELLDARTEVTKTELEQNLAKFKAWIRHVNIERMSASTPIQ